MDPGIPNVDPGVCMWILRYETWIHRLYLAINCRKMWISGVEKGVLEGVWGISDNIAGKAGYGGLLLIKLNAPIYHN